MMRNIYSTFIVAILFIIFSSAIYSYENEPLSKTGKDIEKFKAHTDVQKLQNENIKKINLIEVISKNFGYTTNYEKLRKDYWSARILVSKKQITKAQDLLQKNQKEINESLKVISKYYQVVSQEMIDECIDKIQELEFIANANSDIEMKRKVIDLKDKIRLAYQQFDTASEANGDQRFVTSITLYRSIKSYAIAILKEVAGPDEKIKIDDKYKIHIVDNRNEVYKKS
jgi:hypothetical protein